MARGTTLEQLLSDLRAEIGQATNTSVSRASVDMLTALLERTQERLWNDFDWPHMRVERDVRMEAGDRYYDFPTDIDLTRVERVEVKHGGRWIPVTYGINSSMFEVTDPDLDERMDPVRYWDYYNGTTASPVNQFQVFPIPATNGTVATKELHLRFTGIKNLRSLTAMSDVADLDDQLLILYSASQILARLKSPDAPAKLEEANLHYARLKGRQAGKTQPFKIGGAVDDCSNTSRGFGLRVAYEDADGNLWI